MRHTREDKTTYWEHNHIEDGHSHRDEPISKFQWQKDKWCNQKWIRHHKYLNGYNQVV